MGTLRIENWNIEATTGYKPKTTFYTDFSIADGFGVDAIKDTYKRATEEWKTNVEYITELVMVLNWKGWRWFEHNDTYSQLYTDLYYELDNWCIENLKDDELKYYLRTTD